MATPIITLTSDFGREDFHLPRLRAALRTACGEVVLEDISHDVPVYDIVRAAFVFGRVWHHFPAGTVHLLSVYDFYQPRGRFLAARHQGHYFIGPDNGIFSLLFPERPTEVVVLDRYTDGDSLFSIYAGAAAALAGGRGLSAIGSPATSITERLAFRPVIGKDYLRGAVVFIDRFDNVTTNIERAEFERIGRGRGFRLLLKRTEPLDGLSRRYHDVPEGETLCRFNSDGMLEIAVNLGRAATLLGIQIEDSVQVEFS